MTKAEALKIWREEIKPVTIKQYGKDDKPALAEAWNNWTDNLRQNGEITLKQYNTWKAP
jgi:hypothetical protein